MSGLLLAKEMPKRFPHFDYAGPMTEAVLLGNVAIRAGSRIQWDAESMRVTNNEHANQFIRKALS